jgi:hypothetical protein
MNTNIISRYTGRSFVWHLCLIVACVSLGSCEEEFLERKPKGQLTYDTFFETPDHAVWATNAVYSNFRSWEMCAFPWIGITDILSDDADKGSNPNDAIYMDGLDAFIFDASHTVIAEAWRGHYLTIGRANLAINNIPRIDMDIELRDRLVGESRFLRGYTYLRLVQWFGDIPIIDHLLVENEYYTQVRRPVNEVYDFIEQDLLAAIEVLPEKSEYAPEDLGRATRGAARGMLTRLYMVKHDFVKAAEQAEALIASGEYALLARYADNFLPVGELGAESIFEIATVATQAPVAGPGASPYNMIQGVRGVPNLGWGFNKPSDDLIAEYEPGDPRRQATIIYENEVLPDGSTIVLGSADVLNERFNQKAWVPKHAGLQDNGPGNLRLLRYADVLLLAAEAHNENGNIMKALEYLNAVRTRARMGNNFILKDVEVMDQAALRELIYHERRVELAMEQNRWFDLARWGRIDDEMAPLRPNFTAPKHELLPIPQSEIDLTGGSWMQNNGY